MSVGQLQSFWLDSAGTTSPGWFDECIERNFERSNFRYALLVYVDCDPTGEVSRIVDNIEEVRWQSPSESPLNDREVHCCLAHGSAYLLNGFDILLLGIGQSGTFFSPIKFVLNRVICRGERRLLGGGQ